MIGENVWVWSGRNKGIEGTVISDNGSEYLVDFNRKIRVRDLGLTMNDWYWVKHKDVEVIKE